MLLTGGHAERRPEARRERLDALALVQRPHAREQGLEAVLIFRHRARPLALHELRERIGADRRPTRFAASRFVAASPPCSWTWSQSCVPGRRWKALSWWRRRTWWNEWGMTGLMDDGGQRRSLSGGRRIAGHLIPGCQGPPFPGKGLLGCVVRMNRVREAPGFLPDCR